MSPAGSQSCNTPSPLTAGECQSAALHHTSNMSVSPTLCCVILLAGLAKPMGLVEGPGGLGQGGAAATLGEDSRDAEGKYEEYGYNAQLSDRISLDRSIPDYRPKKYSTSTSCFGLFFMDVVPLRHFHLPNRVVQCYGLVTGRFGRLIPAAVDGFYFCWGAQCAAGLSLWQELFPPVLCFSTLTVSKKRCRMCSCSDLVKRATFYFNTFSTVDEVFFRRQRLCMRHI